MAVRNQAPQAPDLGRISVREIPGLTNEDVRELQILQIGSLRALMNALDDNDGDLTALSTASVVISEEQSLRIGDAVLVFEKTPQAFKDEFTSSVTPPAAAAIPTPTPTPTANPTNRWEKLKADWKAA